MTVRPGVSAETLERPPRWAAWVVGLWAALVYASYALGYL
jgi:hypothetical protein